MFPMKRVVSKYKKLCYQWSSFEEIGEVRSIILKKISQ